MKKLSLIVALAVVLTVGGVFAAWNYNDGAADIAAQTPGVTVNIGNAGSTAGTAGTLVATSTVEYSIDNDDESYVTKIDDKTGAISVTFTADSLASNDVKDGVTLNWKVSVERTSGYETALASNKYKDETLLSVTDSAAATFVIKADGTADATTITADTIFAKIALEEVELKSAEDHAAYKTALATYKIVVTVDYVSANGTK